MYSLPINNPYYNSAFIKTDVCVKVIQSCPTLWPHGLYSPWNSPGPNTGVGSLSLLQGIFPNSRIKPRSPALQADFTSWWTALKIHCALPACSSLPPPNSGQLLIFLRSPKFCLFQMSYSGNHKVYRPSDWLLLLSDMYSRLFHGFSWLDS